MLNFLPPTQLFNEKKIDIFLNEKQNKIIGEINSYPEISINEINFEEEADRIINDLDFKTPKLLKEKTTTGISTLFLTGNQLPPGTLFEYGKKYEVEVADYKVPFDGSKDFFKIYTDKLNNVNLAAVINNDNIIFKLTEYGKITGKATVIEALKQEFLLNIDAIEKVFLQIDKEILDYLPKLKSIIINGLESRKQFLRLKRDSVNNLNPFI